MSLGDGLQAWRAVTQWFKPRSEASMARLMSPKRTVNVNGLQVAVIQRELTLVEHESNFSEVVADSVKTAAMRAMLPKDTLERFLDGLFKHMWERSWLDKRQVVELNPWTSGRSTNPKERTKMSMQYNSVARMIDPTRSTSKSPTMNENPSTVRLPTRHRQHRAIDPTRQEIGERREDTECEQEQASHLLEVLYCAVGCWNRRWRALLSCRGEGNKCRRVKQIPRVGHVAGRRRMKDL